MSPIGMRRAIGTFLLRPLSVMTAACWLATAMPVSAWCADAFAAPAADARILKIIHGWPDDPKPKTAAFLKKFMEKSGGKKPNYGGMRSYDNIYITKMVIETGGVTNDPKDLEADRDRIRVGWTKVKDFDGITGLTTINPERDGAGKATVLTVKDGQLVKVDY